jgi:hypothetical protein
MNRLPLGSRQIFFVGHRLKKSGGRNEHPKRQYKADHLLHLVSPFAEGENGF